MAVYSRSYIEAFGLTDPRVSIWEAESSYTEAEPIPGIPVPSQDTGMVLRSSGVMATGDDVVVRTHRGGFTGPDRATWTWRYSGDDADEQRGWDPYGVISSWQAAVWADGAAGESSTHPHAVTLSDGTPLIVVIEAVPGDPYPYQVAVYTVDAETGAVLLRVTVWESADAVAPYPCLLVLPSGRALCYHWVLDALSGYQVRVWYSDDDGATWALAQDYALPYQIFPATWTPYRIRAAYGSGQVLLLAYVHRVAGGVGRDAIMQWASADLGLTFEYVDVTSVSDPSGLMDVVFAGGVFIVGDTFGPARARVLGSAWTPLEEVASVVIDAEDWSDLDATPNITDGDLALAVDETGIVYAVGRRPVIAAQPQSCVVARSIDYGRTWEGLATGLLGLFDFGPWYYSDQEDYYPHRLAATCSRGRLLVPSSFVGELGTYDDSLVIHFLGGYTTVVMPAYDRFPAEIERAWHGHNWLPYALPSSMGWGANGGVALVESVAAGRLDLQTAAAVARYYDRSPAGSYQLICRWVVEVVAGGLISQPRIAMHVLWSDDAGGSYEVYIYLGPAAFRVYDVGGAVQVGADVPVTYPIDIYVAVGELAVATWWREASDDADREFVPGPAGALVDAGFAAAHVVEWGHISGAGDNTSIWWEAHIPEGVSSGVPGLHDGQPNPDGLLGRGHALTGVSLPSGLRIGALDGASVRGDEWSIDLAHRYPVERIWDYQPRRPWRSTSTAQQILSFEVSDLDDSQLGTDVLLLAFFGASVPQITIHGYTGGAWAAIGTALAYSGMTALQYATDADTVRPAGAAASTLFVELDELAGGYFWFDANDSRRIASNAEGFWTNATTRRTCLTLSGCDGTEAAAGNDGRIVPRNWVALVPLAGVRYQAFRVTIPAAGAAVPAPPEGYYEIGALVVGSLVALGDASSWGGSQTTEAGTEIDEARDRTTTSRAVAPRRRVTEVSWVDGVDTTRSTGATADTDYTSLSAVANTEPAAARYDVPYLLDGLVHRLDGPHLPVVWLPRIDIPLAAGATVLNRRRQLMLARLAERIRLDRVQGDIYDDEVLRVATVSLVEVV